MTRTPGVILGCENVEERPYRALASIYDELVGQTAFECWLENFDRLTRKNGVRFRTAADVACGTGLAAEHLAALCERVYAVDISSEMLEVASARHGRRNISYLCQGFTELELPEKVDLLTCNFDSLNYLTDERDLAEAFTRFAGSLNSGGWAIFDMNTCRQLEAGSGEAVLVHRLQGAFSVWESSWDPSSRINTVKMTNFVEEPGGRYVMTEETHRERAYDLEYIREALLGAGFSSVEAFDAKGLSRPDGDTRRVQFVARVHSRGPRFTE